jgi:hypothetical protein
MFGHEDSQRASSTPADGTRTGTERRAAARRRRSRSRLGIANRTLHNYLSEGLSVAGPARVTGHGPQRNTPDLSCWRSAPSNQELFRSRPHPVGHVGTEHRHSPPLGSPAQRSPIDLHTSRACPSGQGATCAWPHARHASLCENRETDARRAAGRRGPAHRQQRERRARDRRKDDDWTVVLVQIHGASARAHVVAPHLRYVFANRRRRVIASRMNKSMCSLVGRSHITNHRHSRHALIRRCKLRCLPPWCYRP